jgi:hypothetical protein
MRISMSRIMESIWFSTIASGMSTSAFSTAGLDVLVLKFGVGALLGALFQLLARVGL